MEGHLVRRVPYRFALEHLEDRVTPSAPGVLGSTVGYHTETLQIDLPARVDVAVLSFNNTIFQMAEVVQIDFRINLPVFSGFGFQSQPAAFGQSNGLLPGSTNGAFDNDFQASSFMAQSAMSSSAVATGTTSQASSAARQPPSTGTTSRPPVVLTPPVVPVQTNTNPTTSAVQNSQTPNAVLSFATGNALRALSPTAPGAGDSAAAEALRLFPLQSDLGASAVNPLSIINPIQSTPPKMTPLPPSGGGNSAQSDEQAKPPVLEKGMPEQQEAQELLDLFEAGLSAAFVPDNSDDAANALALVGEHDAPSAQSEAKLLMFGLVAASTIGVAHRRNRTKESEQEVLEAASWLPRPLLK